MTNKPNQSEDELREAIWQHIKDWDLERKPGDGYAGATGTDVDSIMQLIETHTAERERIAYKNGWKNAREQSNTPEVI